MSTNPDEGSLKGKGPETMLPSRGNPFPTASAAPAEASPAPAEASPAPAAAPTPPRLDPQATPDLAPHDVARMFPDLSAAAHDPAIAAALQPYTNMPAPAAPAPAAPPAAGPAPAATAAVATPAAPPAAAPPEHEGQRPTGNNMFDPDIEWIGFEVKPDEIGPKSLARITASPDLPVDPVLIAMLVTDDRLRQRWAQIDTLENWLTTEPRVSLVVAQNMLDQLKKARNFLLNSKGKFEDAERELAEVVYLYQRIKRSRWFEAPSAIFAFLIFNLLVIVAAFFGALFFVPGIMALNVSMATLLGPTIKLDIPLLGSTILWGGLGGVTGALYSLWQHVADKKDYDVEHAIYYYANPLMGLMLGAFAYIVVQAGVLTFLQNSPLILYILAWVVGFQQNLAFKLVNNVLKGILPSDGKDGANAS